MNRITPDFNGAEIMPAFQKSITLSESQQSYFEKNGYLIVPSVFNAEEIAGMASEADRILAYCLNASLAQSERNPRLDCSQCPDQTDLLDVRKMQPINDLSILLESVSKDDRLIGPLSQLMQGRKPILMEEKLNYKQKVICSKYIERIAPPVGESQFFLHHDWGYYRSQGYPQETISSAISIDASRSELGPIRVIPGTHKQEWPLEDPDETRGSGIVAGGLFKESDRVEILAPAGSVMFFHSLLLHDSCANRTNEPRRLMIYSHYPDSFTFEEDSRNRSGRRAGQEFEARYLNMKESGAYHDEFSW